ncbi:hypothetical protein [Streptomyces sp. NBC_01244]|uniref:hypothetical protein n=1 Tax=Streptomyces sp. NBC_01244 TaxID=2903797 RepID=UPI002E134B86|nr:hypothetical protein OG247_00355 [Streptomyces sp. NBC_01244]
MGLLSAVGGALVGGLAAVRGARIGAEVNAAAVLAQGRLQAAGALEQWVRQERQKACLQVMDCYGQFSRECVQYREQLKESRPLDEPTLDSFTAALAALVGACSHLALLGPTSVQAAGGVVRAKAEGFRSTLMLWNEELAEALLVVPQPDLTEITGVWLDILVENGGAMNAAYLEFLHTGQTELLRPV